MPEVLGVVVSTILEALVAGVVIVWSISALCSMCKVGPDPNTQGSRLSAAWAMKSCSMYSYR